MDSAPSLPRKALFKTQRVTSKHSQTAEASSDYDKNEIMSSKAKVQFEHDLGVSLKSFDKELHHQRLEQLRHLAEKLKEDAWMYPDLETKLGL